MLPLHIATDRLDNIRFTGDSSFHSDDRSDLHNSRGIQNHHTRLAWLGCGENNPYNQSMHDDTDIDSDDCRRNEEKSLPNDAMGCAWNNDCYWPTRVGYLYSGGVFHRWIRSHRRAMARIWITMCRGSNILLVCGVQRILYTFRGKLKRTLQQAAISSLNVSKFKIFFFYFFLNKFEVNLFMYC